MSVDAGGFREEFTVGDETERTEGGATLNLDISKQRSGLQVGYDASGYAEQPTDGSQVSRTGGGVTANLDMTTQHTGRQAGLDIGVFGERTFVDDLADRAGDIFG